MIVVTAGQLVYLWCFSLFQQIINDGTAPCKGEEKLAALTAADRTPWAKARQRFFNSGVNKASLDAIEKSSFVLVLDEDENGYDPVSISVSEFKCANLV